MPVIIPAWAPEPAAPRAAHALAQFLNLTPLTRSQLAAERPEGDPSLVVGLGRLEPSQAASVRTHLDSGMPGVLDSESAEACGLVSHASGGQPHLSGDALHVDGFDPVAVWPSVADGKGASPALDDVATLNGSEPAAFRIHDSPAIVLRFPVGSIAGWLLGGEGRPSLGSWPLFESPYGPPPAWASAPVLDAYAALVWRAACQSAADFGANLLGLGTLPAGADAVACLSHDLDSLRKGARALLTDTLAALRRGRPVRTAACGAALALTAVGRAASRSRLVRRNQPQTMIRGPVESLLRSCGADLDFFDQIRMYLEVAAERGGRATAFLLDNASVSDGDTPIGHRLTRRVLDLATADGHEIGLHGSLGTGEDPALASEEAEALSNVAGTAIRSTRQHHLMIEARALERYAEIGVAVDSSAGYNDGVGFKAGTAMPFQVGPWLTGDRWLLEVPVVIMDSAAQAAGLRDEEIRALAAQTAGATGFLTINWHPHLFGGRAEHLARYAALLDALPERTEFYSLGALGEWWRGRISARSKVVSGDGGAKVALKTCEPVDRLRLVRDGADGRAEWTARSSGVGESLVTID